MKRSLNVNFPDSFNKQCYNIAFVNSERWLAKSRVDITQCQHGKFSAACKHGNFSYIRAFDIAILLKKYKTFFPHW
jgi:hypothetical protein